MGKGETDYEIWGFKSIPGAKVFPADAVGKLYLAKTIWKKITVCDTQQAALRKLAKMRWPKNGLAIIPMRRKK